MAHVTFIHGISNKPGPDALHRIWREALSRDNGIDLKKTEITSEMVYWADVLYAEPKQESVGLESIGDGVVAPEEDVDMSWLDDLEGEHRDWAQRLSQKFDFDHPSPGDESFEPPPWESEREEVVFERIPLPWWIKKRLMKALLRDVHHYLFNVQHSPQPGVSFRVRNEIRRRALDALRRGKASDGPHVVVCHSMGTVIAYDCLKRVSECPSVDGLLTIGSPLGLDEIQDQLRPEWSRDEGYPSAKVESKWMNVFDRLDPVAGFDPILADDYRQAGEDVINDVNEQNHGRWRHDITKYLGGSKLRAGLAELLGLNA